MILAQLESWAERQILAPAKRALDAVPTYRLERCWECDGSGYDDVTDDECMFCDGSGYERYELSDAARRRIFNCKLRAAGLDPRAFDDNGRLIGLGVRT